MSSDHRAQAPLTNPIDELADESDFELADESDFELADESHFELADDICDDTCDDTVDGIVSYGSGPLLSGELSFIPSKGQWRVLEIIVTKGTELKNVHCGHSLKAYPVLSIGKDGKTFYVSEKRKPVDLDGGSNPVWNIYEDFKLDIDEVLQIKPYLFFRVKSKSIIPGRHSTLVGEASFAIEDLLNNFGDSDDWKSVPLGVKNRKGEQRGNINFKYKFGRILKPKSANLLSLSAEDPPSQSANGNPMDQMGKNDSHSILKDAVAKGAVGGATSACFGFFGELFFNSL